METTGESGRGLLSEYLQRNWLINKEINNQQETND